ncbi:hypothetical protein FE236_09710 [Mariprofundus erugo]|uniref:hypothetical protein n=1 Tax=Mariprofundus erugo TaxID=2528639 RepID=UPI0010FE705C|nr:hypothetical protein [Mariprofundus erugo]TLS75237.1 hypothetical protein FE236_09710 [Mariprofundus erugo]
MPDAFVWYHASEELEPALLAWMDVVETEAGVRGKLYVRKENEKVTFMECYSDVSRPTILRIEQLAAANTLFTSLTRRCESFIRLDNHAPRYDQ